MIIFWLEIKIYVIFVLLFIWIEIWLFIVLIDIWSLFFCLLYVEIYIFFDCIIVGNMNLINMK